jgi:hypothetical protein
MKTEQFSNTVQKYLCYKDTQNDHGTLKQEYFLNRCVFLDISPPLFF